MSNKQSEAIEPMDLESILDLEEIEEDDHDFDPGFEFAYVECPTCEYPGTAVAPDRSVQIKTDGLGREKRVVTHPNFFFKCDNGNCGRLFKVHWKECAPQAGSNAVKKLKIRKRYEAAQETGNERIMDQLADEMLAIEEAEKARDFVMGNHP